MKKFLFGAFATIVLLMGVTSCEKDINEKDDFIGTYWKAQNDDASLTLSFRKDYVKLRVNLKGSDGYYVLSGDYEYYPETSKVVIGYNTTEEKYHYNPAIPEYILGRGILNDDKTKIEYSDTYGWNLTFTRD